MTARVNESKSYSFELESSFESNRKPCGHVPTCVGYLCGLPFLGRERHVGYITGSCGVKALRGRAKNTVLAQTAEELGAGALRTSPAYIAFREKTLSTLFME